MSIRSDDTSEASSCMGFTNVAALPALLLARLRCSLVDEFGSIHAANHYYMCICYMITPRALPLHAGLVHEVAGRTAVPDGHRSTLNAHSSHHPTACCRLLHIVMHHGFHLPVEGADSAATANQYASKGEGAITPWRFWWPSTTF